QLNRKKLYSGEYRLHLALAPTVNIRLHEVWSGHVIAHTWEAEELDALKKALHVWMGRGKKWRKAYALMMTAFRLSSDASVERLMNAKRWLEETPAPQGKKESSEERRKKKEEDIREITEAAVEKAKNLGHKDEFIGRIIGALSWVQMESSRQRFERLVHSVNRKFSNGVDPREWIDDLECARKYRGKIAHGYFFPR